MSKRKKQIRKNFRDSVFSRDDYICKGCNQKFIEADLDAHHIMDRNEMPNGGYVKENGITLCEVCHFKAEQWHSTEGKYWQEGFHPNDLYKLISSSYEEAVEASGRLK